MYKTILALFAFVAVAYAGLIGPLGIGGVSYTQRLNGYGPILGVGVAPVIAKVGVAPVLGVGHLGVGHLGVGHLGVGHLGVGHYGLGVGHYGLGAHGVGVGLY